MSWLFGPSAYRVNVKKLRLLRVPVTPPEGVPGLEEYLRHSTRKMAHGEHCYWKIPCFKYNPKQDEVLSNPDEVELQHYDVGGNPIPLCMNPIHDVQDQTVEDLLAQITIK